MKKLLQGWVFYTAALLFLLSAALTLRGRAETLLGQSGIPQAVDELTQRAVAVWERTAP